MLAESITDDQRDILKMMDSSASSMIHILNDVLDMGKLLLSCTRFFFTLCQSVDLAHP